MLSTIGIVGWEHLEVVILSCLVSRFPILFVGTHGHNKTEGAEILSYATLGTSAKFQPYDTRLIQTEDLLGYANPYSMKEGKEISYVPTQISIFNADSVLFDEINRANPFVASKVMEVVRTRKVMGRQTPLQLVFAAANPPGEGYDTVYLDPAVVSRFSVIRLPDYLSDSDLLKVLSLPPSLGERARSDAVSSFKSFLDLAYSTTLSPDCVQNIRELVTKVVGVLRTELKLHVTPRQARYMVDLLTSCEIISSLGYKVKDKDRVAVLSSLIPEVTGMCKSKVDSSAVTAQLTRVVSGFRMRDSLITTMDILSLLRADVKDRPAWVSTVKSQIGSVHDASVLRKFILGATELFSSSSLDEDGYCSIVMDAMIRMCHLDKDLVPDVPVTASRSEVISWVRSFLVPS